jgi:nucleoside-diphosphate kinase
MSNRTLTMIKPDAMKKGYAGAILDMILKAGFTIVALKQTKLSPEKAGEFYAVHKDRRHRPCKSSRRNDPESLRQFRG